jgi:aspartyl-tRNA(Asn)/glutamyl-tRNA(Gln) amidotransferase subunit A
MLNDDTFFASIDELSAQIRARKLSPVELTEGYLARLEKYGQRLGAVATIMREPAMRDAHQAETEIHGGHYRGVLHGIPFGVKDLLATREAPTTWGATPYKDQKFDFDATVVQRLRNAGAILVAKLAMVELAGGMGYNEADAAWTGAGRSPWNPEYWSGGSSSGPGAASSAALVQFAIGSETSGSIITPSAYCGVTGLRPTYGFVSRHGAMALCWTLDKLGPMCRSAADCAHVLNALAGRDPLDPTSRDTTFRYPPTKQSRRARGGSKNAPLRLAILKDSFEKAQDAVRDNFLATLEVLKKMPGVEITKDVPLPNFPYGPAVGTIVDAEGASAFRDLIESGRVKELASPSGRLGGYSASLVTAVDYLHAMRMRAPMRRAWAEMFKKYDLLVAPSRTTVANPVAKPFDQGWPSPPPPPPVSPIGAANLVGVPAISVPNGFGLMGLPTGTQFVAPAWGEDLLVEIATRYQQATDWHKRRPTLA